MKFIAKREMVGARMVGTSDLSIVPDEEAILGAEDELRQREFYDSVRETIVSLRRVS